MGGASEASVKKCGNLWLEFLNLLIFPIDFIKTEPRPGLNGALFAERSGAKKREWKTETGAQITKFTVKDVLLNL